MSTSLKIETNVRKEDGGVEPEDMEPMSPNGQYFKSSILSCCILAVTEAEISIDESLLTTKAIRDLIPHFSPRFSSIMIEDKNGNGKQWKRVQVNVEDHIKIPVLPAGLSLESYDKHFDDYLSQISTDELPDDRPLWELHVFKYPTKHAPGSFIFKIHHALGDRYSLISGVLTAFRRADDPSKPLTFPTTKNPSNSESRKLFCLPQVFPAAFHGLRDFLFIMRKIYIEDDRTPIRSGDVAMQHKPIRVATISIPLDQIKRIKAKLGVTINDVVVGTIIIANNLYNKQMSQESMRRKRSTILVALNTRATKVYRPVGEMNKKQSGAAWGNRVAPLLIPMPNCAENIESATPLDFIFAVQKIIKRKRISFGALLFGFMLEATRRCRGVEVAARYFYQAIKNTSLTITNLPGPTGKMAFADHPIKGIYFTVAGAPQSMMVSVLSYMQTLRIVFGIEDGYIDRQRLIKCVENAFKLISQATMA